MNELFSDDVASKMVQNVGLLVLITSIAGPELQKRAAEYEDGTRAFDKAEVLRDLRAAANGMVALNLALLNQVEGTALIRIMNASADFIREAAESLKSVQRRVDDNHEEIREVRRIVTVREKSG